MHVGVLRATSIRLREQQDSLLVWDANKGAKYNVKLGYKAALPTKNNCARNGVSYGSLYRLH